MNIINLKLNDKNPRFIKDDKFKKLVKSIEEFPKMLELRPIVYDPANMEILGGNMRYRALKELKYKEIPDNWIKSADKLTEEEKQRFIIEDNVGFGEWDNDLLLKGWGSEQLNDWGLEVPEFDDTLNDIQEVESFSENVNFTIECANLEEFEKLQTKLSTSTKKLSYNDFIIKTGL